MKFYMIFRGHGEVQKFSKKIYQDNFDLHLQNDTRIVPIRPSDLELKNFTDRNIGNFTIF